MLQELCRACVGVMDRQLSTQLPGGKFCNPSADLVEQAKSCSATNISGERVFAMSDQVMARARNAQISHVESQIMYKSNKTMQWLINKDAADKKTHVAMAIKEARVITQEDRDRKRRLLMRLSENLVKARKTLLAKEDKDREKQEMWLDGVYNNGGLWGSAAEVEKHVSRLTKTKATAAIKCQLNVRTKLHATAQPKILLTKASLRQLQEHLVTVIQTDVPVEQEDFLELLIEPTQLLGRRFSQRWRVVISWHLGVIEDELQDGQFELNFENGDTCFMKFAELLVDVARDDLDLV